MSRINFVLSWVEHEKSFNFRARLSDILLPVWTLVYQWKHKIAKHAKSYSLSWFLINTETAFIINASKRSKNKHFDDCSFNLFFDNDTNINLVTKTQQFYCILLKLYNNKEAASKTQ